MTRVERLEAARDALAAAIASADEARLPALVKEYRATLAELESLAPEEPEQKGTALDELKKRRAARLAGAADCGGSAESSV